VRPDRALATGRDAVADTYHDAWPPYPAVLFHAIAAAPGLPPAARVFEIGCGDRRRLLSEVARVVDGAGGRVPLDVATMLYVARRKRAAPSWARRLPLPVRQLGNRLIGR
jgi:hypothetical protein